MSQYMYELGERMDKALYDLYIHNNSYSYAFMISFRLHEVRDFGNHQNSSSNLYRSLIASSLITARRKESSAAKYFPKIRPCQWILILRRMAA